jgi:hypothetical protein
MLNFFRKGLARETKRTQVRLPVYDTSQEVIA